MTRRSNPSLPAINCASCETRRVRMLRTEAEVVGDGELLIAPRTKTKRGDYRRARDVATVLVAFCSLPFSWAFLALTRCLLQATFFVLFILLFPFLKNIISN